MTELTGQSPAPGDLGRRVAHRREELGLTREQLARQAGMAVGYLEYLEQHTAQVTPAAVLRLASALDMTADELLGGSVERPPGGGRPANRPSLETLGEEECRRLMASGGVGRVVFVADGRPVALPVNFRMLDDDVAFRTAEGTSVTSLSESESVSFEVDHVDEAMSEGWSVLVTGRLRRVSPDEFRRLEQLGVEPWAGGSRTVNLVIEPHAVSGRRIHARG